MENKCKILVVDDDSFVTMMLTQILEENGHPALNAADGVQALREFTRHPEIGMIISDMNMPVMNGLDLIKNLRSNAVGLPIIILTANNEISVALEAIQSGASDYLLKDENIQDTLMVSVDKVLEKHNLKLQNAKLLQDLVVKNEELLKLNQLKNKFLGMASHDLRNPLCNIIGMSEILLEISNATDARQWITNINTVSNQMMTMLNDLLDISMIEQDKLVIKYAKKSLNQVIEQGIQTNKMTARKKNIRIHAELQAISVFQFDADKIVQVFDNLVSNAIKYSPIDSDIYVYLSRQKERVKVSIKDAGPGISQEDQGKLFGEFQRLSAQPTNGEKSTGLGLAIVKKIITLHQGELIVDSKLGQGSTFSFIIPLKN